MGKKREKFIVTEEEVDDFTSKGTWEINGEVYNFIEDYPSRNCDGECHNVVTERESDGKYFEFFWMLTRSESYHYGEDWKEVFPKTVTTTTYE